MMKGSHSKESMLTRSKPADAGKEITVVRVSNNYNIGTKRHEGSLQSLWIVLSI